MKDKLILYSGGMDSTVLLNQFKDEIEIALIFNYGSNHNKIENKQAIFNCDSLGIKWKLVELELSKIGFKSNLLGGDIPHGHYEDESMKKTVVPFRNGVMLSIAAGIAESLNLKYILIANHHGDHSIYPDCRKDFIENMSNAIKYGTYNNIEIMAPYTMLSKREIALKGKDLKVDFSETYSCYEGGEFHCGECGTCVERKEALEGFDTTLYKMEKND